MHRRIFPAIAAAASLLLAHCSALSSEVTNPGAPPSDYGVLVSNSLKTFMAIAAYRDFQISGLRWVHAVTGWSWLTCVRYQDQGHARTYSFFIDNGSVVSARYDIMIDKCSAQQYLPFDAATGAIGTPPSALHEPIY